MQRAAQKEEKIKEDEEFKSDGDFVCPGTVKRKCVVVMEGDPRPGAIKGRMSFQSFNPSIDKLNEEAVKPGQPKDSATSSGDQTRRTYRDNESSLNGAKSLNEDDPNYDANGDHKRKQPEVVPEPQYPNKSPKRFQGNQQSSQNSSSGSFKQPRREKQKQYVDWNVLRPPRR